MRVLIFAMAAVVIAELPAAAQSSLPGVGWQATLRKINHNTSGQVTIVDDDTLRIDNFTYDGGGLDVYFYLGVDESIAAFTAGLPIGTQLLGSVFDGSQPPLFIDLPPGETIDGWNAISLWCVAANVSFGHGTFRAPGDFDFDGDVDGRDFLAWQRGGSPIALSASDLADWQSNYGVGMLSAMVLSPAAADFTYSGASPVPEPGSLILLGIGMIAVGRPATRFPGRDDRAI